MKYADIIERLEKATGTDKELDARIWAALAGVKYVKHYEPYGDRIGRTQVEYSIPPMRRRLVTNPPHMPHAEPYTASIDASLALVERMLPGWSWLVRDDEAGAFCNISAPEHRINPTAEWIDGKTCFPSWAPTAPLAILAALFKALEAKERGE